MPVYKAPLDDIRFVLNDVLHVETLTALPGYEQATADVIDPVLEAAADLCENVLFPLNQPADAEGCHLNGSDVTTPKGFKDAYTAFTAGGWTGLASDPTYGGMGLPQIMKFVVDELACSANMSFAMYPGLSDGAYNALLQHGTDTLKNLYLPKLVAGTWSGTMCLTEPHCGTDLGLIRTRAEPIMSSRPKGRSPEEPGPSSVLMAEGPGSPPADAGVARDDTAYKITGTKIFISAGEHDLTENILHLVLAKLPDAPEGVKGISLFLVPKFMVNPDGTIGSRNGVACGNLEHKMGIKANATCVLNFDGAVGYLVGQPHNGLKAMFTMMNVARLGVAMQGLGIAEVAYQNALAYARDRLQMRSVAGVSAPDKPADPIIVHPDVRRMILTCKAFTEGARMLSLMTGLQLDVAEKHTDPGERERADDWVALLTPVLKAYQTDMGFECANLAIQVHGGHGYIREYGVEQYARDARIAMIYEGTNGIQALDLIGRKMGLSMGRLLRRFFHPVQGLIDAHMAHPTCADMVMNLAKGFAKLQQTTALIAQKGMKDPEEGAAAATDYLRLFALVAMGYAWVRMSVMASEKLAAGGVSADRAAFYTEKLKTARFFFDRMFPEYEFRFRAAMSGKDSTMAAGL